MLKKLYTFEIFFAISCFLVFSIIICFIFPQPYFSIAGGMDPFSSYDAEADYFANIINTYLNGYSVDFLHPGIPINTLSSFVLRATGLTGSVEQIILVVRSTLLFLNLILIYVGTRLILKKNI